MYLGIDLGTSAIKSILMNKNQEILDTTSISLTISRPYEGWSEQSPDEWYQAMLESIDQLASRNKKDFRFVEGIGLAGQMHGLVIINSQGEVIRPAILWNDSRSKIESDELEKQFPHFIALTGNRVMAGFTAPKVAWLKKNEFDNFKDIYKVLLPKDFLNWKLTGKFNSEPSDSSGTLWLSGRERVWSKKLLSAVGLKVSQMPNLVEGWSPAGSLLEKLTKRWNIDESPVVAGGGGDNAASACGIGAIEQGDSFISLGTSGVLWVTTDRFYSNPEQGIHSFSHAIPNRWTNMAVILSAMDSLHWLSEIIGKTSSELTTSITGKQFSPSKIIFHPYLSGERTPYNNPSAHGAFIGINRKHGLNDIVHAVLDGIAYAFYDCYLVLRQLGHTISNVPVIGGGSHSVYLLEVLATLFDTPLLIPEAKDYGAAFGAARLGQVASIIKAKRQVSHQDLRVYFSKPRIKKIVYPKKKVRSVYLNCFKQYQKYYPLLNVD